MAYSADMKIDRLKNNHYKMDQNIFERGKLGSSPVDVDKTDLQIEKDPLNTIQSGSKVTAT